MKEWLAGKLIKFALFYLMDQDTRRQVIYLLNRGVEIDII